MRRSQTPSPPRLCLMAAHHGLALTHHGNSPPTTTIVTSAKYPKHTCPVPIDGNACVCNSSLVARSKICAVLQVAYPMTNATLQHKHPKLDLRGRIRSKISYNVECCPLHATQEITFKIKSLYVYVVESIHEGGQ